MMKTSVIVTTYNRPDALHAVLAAIKAQHVTPYEVIVADDGSEETTRKIVQSLRSSYPCTLLHVWHADEGFRAAAIRNLAVAASQGDYLIFLDGECITRPNLLDNHARFAENGWFVAGHRILLNAELTQKTLDSSKALHAASGLFWLNQFLLGRCNRISPLITLPNASWRKQFPTRWEGARTCNLAMWRQDFFRINGFDEKYAGWGHEDADLAVRLINSGVFRKDGRFGTGVFHLWHRESDRGQSEANFARLQHIQATHQTLAETGVSRYDAHTVQAALR